MALPKRKKEESTNEKIVRLFQEGKSVEDICAEIELRNDIVVGVIRRKLGDDAIPETVVTAKPRDPENADAQNDEPADPEGLSKLERYMLEKKKKQQDEAAAEPAPEPAANTRVSLVDDYKMQQNAAQNVNNNIPSAPGGSEMDEISMEGISIDDLGTADTAAPSQQQSAPAEELVEMDAISLVEMEQADSAVDNNFTEPAPTPAPAAEEPAVNVSAEKSAPGSAASKMKAFAMSQIEANNAKIAELTKQSDQLENQFAPMLNNAVADLTASQNEFADIEAQCSKAYSDRENAREAHRTEIAKADDDYRRKLEQIDKEYKQATAEANERLQAYEDSAKSNIESLENRKTAAQADLLTKQNAVTELRAKIRTEGDEIQAKIQSLKEENEGYNNFL